MAGRMQMKQRMSRLVVCTVAAFLAGCAQPCFYQAGKSLEECRRDLRQCLAAGRPEMCMQNKGYQGYWLSLRSDVLKSNPILCYDRVYNVQ
jgi:hypothetical protein